MSHGILIKLTNVIEMHFLEQYIIACNLNFHFPIPALMPIRSTVLRDPLTFVLQSSLWVFRIRVVLLSSVLDFEEPSSISVCKTLLLALLLVSLNAEVVIERLGRAVVVVSEL